MEIGVRTLARCLGIPDPIKPADRSWGAVLQKVRDGIDAKWPTVATRLTGDGEVFEFALCIVRCRQESMAERGHASRK